MHNIPNSQFKKEKVGSAKNCPPTELSNFRDMNDDNSFCEAACSGDIHIKSNEMSMQAAGCIHPNCVNSKLRRNYVPKNIFYFILDAT